VSLRIRTEFVFLQRFTMPTITEKQFLFNFSSMTILLLNGKITSYSWIRFDVASHTVTRLKRTRHIHTSAATVCSLWHSCTLYNCTRHIYNHIQKPTLVVCFFVNNWMKSFFVGFPKFIEYKFTDLILHSANDSRKSISK